MDTTPSYRAVNLEELSDLTSRSGAFRNPFGFEVQYLSETAAGAALYARQAYGTGRYEGPYTIVRTEILSHLIHPLMRTTTARGIPTVVVPTVLLLRLSPAQPLLFTPTAGSLKRQYFGGVARLPLTARRNWFAHPRGESHGAGHLSSSRFD